MFKKVAAGLSLAVGYAVAIMMAEVERATTKYTAQGAEPTVIEGMAANDTQLIPNKLGNVILRVTAPAEAIEVTVVTPNAVGGNPIEDLKNPVGSSKVEIMGPFDPGVYNNSKGQLEVKFNKAGVKLEIIEVGF